MGPSNPPRNVTLLKKLESVAIAPQLLAARASCQRRPRATSTLSASQSALYLTNCSFKAAALTDLLFSFALVAATRARSGRSTRLLVLRILPGMQDEVLGLLEKGLGCTVA
jgi:hypothetical protein